MIISIDAEKVLEKNSTPIFDKNSPESILAWKIPWREEPGRLQSVASQSQT